MRPAARIQAAIDIVHEMQSRHRPASTVLADWGKAHRYAGSGDRAAIGNLVFDALRRRASAVHHMQAETARAVVLGSLRIAGGMTPDDIDNLFDGSQHGPKQLDPNEAKRIAAAPLEDLPAHVAAEVPAWIATHFDAVFGQRMAAEGRALADRAPVDLRVNTLKSTRAETLKSLLPHEASATPLSALGIRVAAPEGSKRTPNVEAEISHGRGWFEVQDEGSQIAAALTGVRAGEEVLDLCAGAGGKTLAMAAAMGNKGRIFAYDDDKIRLRPIVERIARAGATSIDIVNAGDTSSLAALGARFDCVLVDAPCTGSGTWRRKPDAKWRLKPKSIAERQSEQRAVLETAVRHVKPGGRLVYVTCSVLPDENTAQIAAFLAEHTAFTVMPTAEAWRHASAGSLAVQAPASADGRTDTLLMTPASHGTDGFFVAVLQHRG